MVEGSEWFAGYDVLVLRLASLRRCLYPTLSERSHRAKAPIGKIDAPFNNRQSFEQTRRRSAVRRYTCLISEKLGKAKFNRERPSCGGTFD